MLLAPMKDSFFNTLESIVKSYPWTIWFTKIGKQIPPETPEDTTKFLRGDNTWAIPTGAIAGPHAGTHELAGSDLVSHDNLTDFVLNKHIDHSTVSIIAGTGLSGGGTISANRTLTVDESAIDHGGLSGLSDDDHTQYALLLGRSAGQTLIGGIASGEDLTLQSTSHATKGSLLLGTSAYDEVNNRLGIGIASPTAALHLKAGTAAASTAPLKLTSGTLNTSSEAGAIEFDGHRFYATGTNRRILSRASDSIVTSTTAANTTDETTLFTATLVANSLSVNKVYKITFFGSFGTHDASSVVTIKMKINGTIIVTLASTAGSVTDKPWHGFGYMTCRTTGVSGTVSSHGDIMLNNTTMHTNTASIVVNTTTINSLILTTQWDTAYLANTLTIDQGFLEVVD